MGTASLRWTVILVIIMIFPVAYWLKPQNVQFWEFKQEDVVRLFTQLILVALIIERALEVILTPWRGPEAERMTAELQHHDQLAKSGNPTAQDNLQKSKLDLTDFKCKTQNLAFKVSFVLGIIVASFGIRTLAPLVEPNAFGKLPHLQQVGFAALDVLLTGALLSGGADGLHQVLSLFLDYVGKTRDRVQAAG
ncbi:MAG: hypothetical protein AUI12_13520 [Acidobacteria bacterium 13_2_20CM_2_57_6]|nr:MAG: hypothetical protein AUI12_13520 [Acidobacteria bacterium 13_2_20CM_2_57_6]